MVGPIPLLAPVTRAAVPVSSDGMGVYSSRALASVLGSRKPLVSGGPVLVGFWRTTAGLPAVVRLRVQLAPYIGTETVEDFPVAWLVTAMTTHDGLRTRIMPGNWVSRPSQASIV
jgi:hypothetical protein